MNTKMICKTFLVLAAFATTTTAHAFTMTSAPLAAGSSEDLRCCMTNVGRRAVDVTVTLRDGSGRNIGSNARPASPGNVICAFASVATGFPGYCTVEGQGSSKQIRASVCAIGSQDYGSEACAEVR